MDTGHNQSKGSGDKGDGLNRASMALEESRKDESRDSGGRGTPAWKWFALIAGAVSVLAVIALLALNVWAKKTVDKINWLGGP